MADQNGLLDIVKGFAQELEKTLGTEKTSTLLTTITNFAKECPDTIGELEELVEGNPAVFKSLLTREGVIEAKEMIEKIAVYAPLIGSFGG